MNLFKFLRFKKNRPLPNDILRLWEDDYLMLELLPHDNLEFVKLEIQRVKNFSEEHFDGVGFTDITSVSEKPIKTIEKVIDLTEIEGVITATGLKKISQFNMQGVGLLQGDKAPLGFGTNRFAIMCDKQNSLLKNIWVTGHTDTDEEIQVLALALLKIGQTYNFIAVNWFRGEYYNLIENESVIRFIKNSC